MYTPGTVRTLMRPLTVCVVLLFGAGPVAILACELACSSPIGHGDHQSSHHQHASQVVQPPHQKADLPSLTAPASTCDHTIAVAPAVTSIVMRVVAPAAIQAVSLALPDSGRTYVTVLRHASGAPPGARSGPVSLRI